MVLYCKKCGYVFGEGYVPKLVSKGVCPVCRNKLYKTQEGIGYFQSRIEKSMPTWEDVVRHKYLKNITLDTEKSSKRSDIEQKKQQEELRKLKNNSNQTEQSKFIPKGNKFGIECPYCHATNVKKISGFSKAVEVGLLGILAMDRMGKQWHCNHCNSDF